MLKQRLAYLRSQFYDEKFSAHKLAYLLQSGFATFAVFVTLFFLQVLPNAVLIACIASTTCTIFIMPHRDSTRVRYIVLGYIIGASAGVLCDSLLHANFFQNLYFIQLYGNQIFGSLAVGVAIFLMVVFNGEHPPAVALSFAFVIEDWTIKTIIVTFIAVTMILGFRKLFKPYMHDLL